MANSATSAQLLGQYASQARLLRAQISTDASQLAAVNRVKLFQSKRLAQTHSDLLASPRYGLAATFFLKDLYGSHQIDQRDNELSRVIPVMQRFLPEPALAVIARAAQVDALSERLDQALAQRCAGSCLLSLEDYQLAYRQLHEQEPAARDTQMGLIVQIGQSLDGLIRKPLLGGLLKTMGPAAHAAGFNHLHDFLTRGFNAFKHMNGANQFIQTIEQRERDYHHQLVG